MKFSIIIPAYNEAKYIQASVKALQAQSWPRNDFEIIVVDNNSSDKTYDLAKAAGADKVILETEPGANMARQRGYQEATGQIIAFLDADSLPHADWLKHIAQVMDIPQVQAVSGPFDFGFLGVHRVLDRIYTRRLLPHLDALLALVFGLKAGVIVGGNFAVRRKALEKIGGLPKLKFWGDDAATAMLIRRQVGIVRFDPEMVVPSSPRRFDDRGFFRLSIRYAIVYFKIYFSRDYR